mmetsp:Transcript_20137/g.41750  ORF Transcript_20137/g.41750 Transcript_20137/m.41750 type:complete len:276 (+) Transcript_20137:101-928(+)
MKERRGCCILSSKGVQFDESHLRCASIFAIGNVLNVHDIRSNTTNVLPTRRHQLFMKHLDAPCNICQLLILHACEDLRGVEPMVLRHSRHTALMNEDAQLPISGHRCVEGHQVHKDVLVIGTHRPVDPVTRQQCQYHFNQRLMRPSTTITKGVLGRAGRGPHKPAAGGWLQWHRARCLQFHCQLSSLFSQEACSSCAHTRKLPRRLEVLALLVTADGKHAPANESVTAQLAKRGSPLLHPCFAQGHMIPVATALFQSAVQLCVPMVAGIEPCVVG